MQTYKCVMALLPISAALNRDSSTISLAAASAGRVTVAALEASRASATLRVELSTGFAEARAREAVTARRVTLLNNFTLGTRCKVIDCLEI